MLKSNIKRGWDLPKPEPKKQPVTFEEGKILDDTVADIKEKLGQYTLEELDRLLIAEKAGRNRSTLIEEIENQIEDLEG